MAEPNKEKVITLISFIERDLQEIVFGAWKDWIEGSEYGRTRFNRTRANIVWDRMIDRAYNKFSGNKQIYIVEKDTTVLFILDDQVVFRFKKGNSSGFSNNYPTQTSFNFYDQDVPLFGDLTLCRVEVVYVLNNLGTQINDILIVARHGGKILWTHSIVPADMTVEMPQRKEQQDSFIDQLVEVTESTPLDIKNAKDVGE